MRAIWPEDIPDLPTSNVLFNLLTLGVCNHSVIFVQFEIPNVSDGHDAGQIRLGGFMESVLTEDALNKILEYAKSVTRTPD